MVADSSAKRTKKAIIFRLSLCARAENETRTRDPNLGKVVLYQLSYFRNCECKYRAKIVTCKIFGYFFSKRCVLRPKQLSL